jgi:very-short-patch-repair endonuclease
MSIFKTCNSIKIIPIHIFDYCKIDGVSKKEIINLFPSRSDGAYYLNKFINYLSKYHSIDLKIYIKKYFNENWPNCPISGESLGFKVSGAGIIISQFKKGKINKENCPAFKKACEKLSTQRLGENNPMYGKKAWNSGLNKNSDNRIKKISDKACGRKFSNDHKNKLKEARKQSPIKARHTTKHSESSIKKMRNSTVRRWESGLFSFKKTSIERKVELWLEENLYKYIYQYSINGFVADFACPKTKVVIECQGDFFHCNPKINKYAEPVYAVQKRNIYRDQIKRKVYSENGWLLIELWESEINSGEFKQILSCALKK